MTGKRKCIKYIMESRLQISLHNRIVFYDILKVALDITLNA